MLLKDKSQNRRSTLIGATDGTETINICLFCKTLENECVVVVEKELKNSPNDMEIINMWADKSFGDADARSNKRPLQSTSKPANTDKSTNAVTVISDIDIAKICKDAEMLILNGEKVLQFAKSLDLGRIFLIGMSHLYIYSV
ncbi:MAG: hypothetical protein K6E54_10770 [Bacteroidaceae bacterium]|nr:hypothetical protein [Bacteroidaceae bacterium]